MEVTAQPSLSTIAPELLTAICSWMPGRAIAALGLTSRGNRTRVAYPMRERIAKEYPEVPTEQYQHNPIGFYLARKQVEKRLYSLKSEWRVIGQLEEAPFQVDACTVVTLRSGVSKIVFSLVAPSKKIWLATLDHETKQCPIKPIELTEEAAADLRIWLGQHEPASCWTTNGVAMVLNRPIRDLGGMTTGTRLAVRSIEHPSQTKSYTWNKCVDVHLLSAYQSSIFAIGVDKGTRQKHEGISFSLIMWDVASGKISRQTCGKPPEGWKFGLALQGFRWGQVPRAWLHWNHKAAPLFAWAWNPRAKSIWLADFKRFKTRIVCQLLHEVDALLPVSQGLLIRKEDPASQRNRVSLLTFKALLPFKPLSSRKDAFINWNRVGFEVADLSHPVLPSLAQGARLLQSASLKSGMLTCYLTTNARLRPTSRQAGYLFRLQQTGVRQYCAEAVELPANVDTIYRWGCWKKQPTLIRLNRSFEQISNPKRRGRRFNRELDEREVVKISVSDLVPGYYPTKKTLLRKEQLRTSSSRKTTSHSDGSQQVSTIQDLLTAPGLTISPANDLIIRLNPKAARAIAAELNSLEQQPLPPYLRSLAAQLERRLKGGELPRKKRKRDDA